MQSNLITSSGCRQAASLTQLSVEAVANWGKIVFQTEVDLEKLVAGATVIEISHNSQYCSVKGKER
jgi:pyroglutamyl-peptidase